jgi:hypothetical protein
VAALCAGPPRRKITNYGWSTSRSAIRPIVAQRAATVNHATGDQIENIIPPPSVHAVSAASCVTYYRCISLPPCVTAGVATVTKSDQQRRSRCLWGHREGQSTGRTYGSRTGRVSARYAAEYKATHRPRGPGEGR